MRGAAVTGLLLLVALPARAARPDEGGGMFPYDASDVVEHLDGPAGIVRVHYSVDGPNVTRLTDTDASGLPDFAEEVAVTAESVLLFYSELGLRPPVAESELGLDPLGGTDGLDIYLVDFGGTADGWFTTDACDGSICAGHVVMENDFIGYGYGSISEAVEVLTSHELFHAVQAAYNAGQPSWMSEGTAVWGEYQYMPGVWDFYAFADEYLADAGRSIDQPPAGTGGWFTYGTGLFFQFLSERHGVDAVVAVQERMEGLSEDEGVDAIAGVLEELGADLSEEWTTFARWNLATGRRSGVAESYPFAAELSGVSAELEVEDGQLDDDNRFYPLAATYYRLDHPGGALRFAAEDDPTGLVFSLHRVADGEPDGPVEDPAVTWTPTEAGVTEELGELEAGGWWLVGTYPEQADQSVKVRFCLGEDVSACLVGAGDTGEPDTPSVPGDSAAADAGETGGCGCATGSAPAGGLALLVGLLGLSWRRRRPSEPTSRAC